MKHADAVLLVEGRDDEHVLYALAVAHQLPQTFAVKAIDGKDPLLSDLKLRLKARNERRLAVMLDADEDLAARWRAVRTLVDAAFPGKLPEAPDRDGAVVELAEGFTFGAWLMPDNTLPGVLETFLAFLVPTDDAVMPRVDAMIGALGEARRFPEVRVPKARIHAWLALQEEPGKPLGQAITARYLDPQLDAAKRFVAWLRRMFPVPTVTS